MDRGQLTHHEDVSFSNGVWSFTTAMPYELSAASHFLSLYLCMYALPFNTQEQGQEVCCYNIYAFMDQIGYSAKHEYTN